MGDIQCKSVGRDVCMKIQVGDFEVSVVFTEEKFGGYKSPSDLKIYDKGDNEVTSKVFEEEDNYHTISSFEDITEAIELLKNKTCCVVCGKMVDHALTRELFEEIFNQVDMYGVESLTEKKQVVYEYHCCSEECFEKME